jgi:hypothetical protein
MLAGCGYVTSCRARALYTYTPVFMLARTPSHIHARAHRAYVACASLYALFFQSRLTVSPQARSCCIAPVTSRRRTSRTSSTRIEMSRCQLQLCWCARAATFSEATLLSRGYCACRCQLLVLCTVCVAFTANRVDACCSDGQYGGNPRSFLFSITHDCKIPFHGRVKGPEQSSDADTAKQFEDHQKRAYMCVRA